MAASSISPGRGLRQSHPSPLSWKQVRKSSIGSIAAIRACIASTSLARKLPARDVGLVGHDDQQVPSRLEALQRLWHAGQYLQLVRPRGRIWLSVTH